MEIRLADSKDKQKIIKYDNHIHHNKVGECIWNQLVYVLCDEKKIVGVLRYSLFWQSIPFLDLLYIDEDYRGKGFGRQMMEHWESVMRTMKYNYVMLSTQEDETAKYFYEKLGYHRIGAFLPPEQDEYDEAHIPGAILIPYTQIEEKANEMLPDKDQLILAYCRIGRRSKLAAEILVELGYTNIKEFGGIIDWPYEVE